MSHQYDLIIIGSGLAGSSLAVALRHLPIRIAMLDTQPMSQSQPQADQRPITLNHTSQQILQTLGLWETLQPTTQRIHQLHVSQAGYLGCTQLHANDVDIPALGYVTPFEQLKHTLQQAAHQSHITDFIQIQHTQSIHTQTHSNDLTVVTHSGQSLTLHSPLLIIADGAQSTSKELLGIHSDTRQYDDQSLIFEATLDSSSHCKHTAYQRFTSLGSIAWLPSWQPERARIVWTLSGRQHQRIATWDSNTITQHINQQYRGKTAPITHCQQTGCFPLHTSLATQPQSSPVILIGNAAHTLYPITAQGFNLTLLNVAMLAQHIFETHQTKRTTYCPTARADYLAWSTTTQQSIQRSTAAIDQAFGLHLPLTAHLRGLGLLAIDCCSMAKRRIIQRFLGRQTTMPKLACQIPLQTTIDMDKPVEAAYR